MQNLTNENMEETNIEDKIIKEKLVLENNATAEVTVSTDGNSIERGAKLAWNYENAMVEAKINFKGVEGRALWPEENKNQTSTEMLITVFEDGKVAYRFCIESNKQLLSPSCEIVVGEGEKISSAPIDKNIVISQINEFQQCKGMNSVVSSMLTYVVGQLKNQDRETSSCPIFLKLLARVAENKHALKASISTLDSKVQINR